MVKMNCEMALCWIKKKSKFIPKLETNFEAHTCLTNKLKCFKLSVFKFIIEIYVHLLITEKVKSNEIIFSSLSVRTS